MTSPWPRSGRLAGRAFVTLLVAASLALSAAAGEARAAEGDVGYQDGSTSGTGSATGTKRPESALWFNDGLWWANMWDPVSDDFHIFRLNAATQTWSDTGVRIDSRSGTSADTLWDGSHLYVSSHAQNATASSGKPSYLFRYSYNPINRSYSLDSGFPAQINNVATETLVIAKDSTGRLWATWQQASRIYVNRTLGDDRTWGTPFVLPASATSVDSDDISSIVAFGGNKLGILWGNQAAGQDGFYFAVHDDGQPDTTWRATEPAWRGSDVADDHINLKADSTGRVYAAVKTSLTGAAQVQTALLVRDPVTEGWSRSTLNLVADCANRPTVVVDEAGGAVHVFHTGPAAPDFACSDQGGDIYEKAAPLSTLAFPSGRGTVVLRDDANHQMHNNTSTKQTVSSASGLVALAVEQASLFYWHSYDPLAPPGPPVAEFSGSPTSGTAPLAVSFSDRSTGLPTSWSWDFGDGTTSTAQNATHTYSTPGTYTVTLTATNAAGTDRETKTDYITVTPSTAPLTFTPVADARVHQSEPTVNFGTATSLRAKSSTTSSYQSFLRFTVAGLTGPVQSAKLRFYVTDPSPDGGGIHVIGDNWSESTVTWNTRPPITGSPIATLGAVSLNTFVEFDLTGAITADGTYNLALKSTSGDTVYYNSREGAHPPQLIITQGG